MDFLDKYYQHVAYLRSVGQNSFADDLLTLIEMVKVGIMSNNSIKTTASLYFTGHVSDANTILDAIITMAKQTDEYFNKRGKSGTNPETN